LLEKGRSFDLRLRIQKFSSIEKLWGLIMERRVLGQLGKKLPAPAVYGGTCPGWKNEHLKRLSIVIILKNRNTTNAKQTLKG